MMLSQRFHQVITANALLFLEAENDPELRQACESASLVVPESAGAIWALKRLGIPDPYQLAGVDLAFRLCQMAREQGRSVFLIGGKPGVSETAARVLMAKIPGLDIAGTLDGYFDKTKDDLIINTIRESRPAVVLAAMGMPAQDKWIHARRATLPGAICMGVGGTFDVWAGQIKRAPPWFQKRGLEWLYRFYQEPWRWNRMALLPVFALKVLFSTIRAR